MSTTLEQTIETKRQEIHTDAYPMSIGELVNLYIDGDLDIHPEFQRVYRWTEMQKSRLIESILLGIPLPSIFVAQRDDGVWDVVDGVQRLSTIFSFLGIYKDEKGELIQPLILKGTEQLPELEQVSWDKTDLVIQSHFSKELQRTFKREKIDLKIIKKESDASTKFELFQRLNTLGSSLSDQEVRNCLVLMLNSDVYDWFVSLCNDSSFLDTLPLTDRQMREQYHMDLATRFIVLTQKDWSSLAKMDDVGQYLTDAFRTLIQSKRLDLIQIEKNFRETFKILKDEFGENAFRKRVGTDYRGPFSLAAFESIAIGLGSNLDTFNLTVNKSTELRRITNEILNDSSYSSNSGNGVRGTTRMPRLVELGKGKFANS